MKIKDVDDAHAQRFHGQKNDDVTRPKAEKKQETTPTQKAHHEGELKREAHVERKTKKRAQEEKEKRRDQGSSREEPEAPEVPDGPKVKAGQLALDDNYNYRRHTADKLGIEGPDFDSFGAESAGQSLTEALGRPRHPDLPSLEIEPPIFLKPLEAMQDVYMKVKGRVSRRTKELLEGIDLEDLIDMMHALFDDERLVKNPEARLRRNLLDAIGKETGPLLAGFHDPRVTELWRLFVDGWDIWVPEGKETGVDLFWEGEAEDDDGNVIEILQSLQLREREATLYTKFGDLEDRITFDGEAFYRLKTVLD